MLGAFRGVAALIALAPENLPRLENVAISIPGCLDSLCCFPRRWRRAWERSQRGARAQQQEVLPRESDGRRARAGGRERQGGRRARAR